MMKRLFGLVSCFLATLAWAENVTFEQAGEAARQVEIPNFANLITQDKINETLPPTSFGDTSGLSDLRGDDGMGDIKTPGLNKAIACDTKNDPECLAIQMLRYGSANNPKFDESTEAQIKGEYSSTIGNKDAILGDLGNLGSQERVCETVETVIPGQSATEVCDITTGIGITSGMCEEGWEESKSLLVYYQCTMKALSVENACTVITTPITHTEDIYQCTDRAAIYEDSTCVVTTTAITHKEDIYQCVDRSAVYEDSTCAVTTTPITHTEDIYQCTDRSAVYENSTCAVTTKPITHTEDIYQCTDRSAVYENSTCAITTTPITHDTDIYQCTDRSAVYEDSTCAVATTPITHTEDIYQCTDRSAVYENSTCAVTTTPITHTEDIYQCTDRSAVYEDSTCAVTTTPITHKEDIYQCVDRSAVYKDSTCAVTTTPITHTEDIYQCTDRAETYETRTCDVPATVVVDKTYPYTCPITMAQEVKKSCVRTLDMVVTPLCSEKDPPATEIRLNPWRTLYGWRPGSANYGFQVIMECRASLDTYSVQFVVNGTVLGTVTSLPARIQTDIKGFGIIIEARRVVINHEHVIEVDVTNVDTGMGSTTLSGTVVMETLTQQEHEVWTESCDVASSANETCTVTSATCLDTSPSYVFNGYRVFRDCWQWQEERTCSDGQSVDHCTTLAKESGCKLEKEECLSMNAGGQCAKTQRTYACDHAVTGLPSDNVALDTRVTIDSSFDKAGACATLIADKNCTEKSHICTETTGTKVVDGVDVTLSCWAEQYSYSCKTSNESLTCNLLGGAGCTHYKDVSDTASTSVDQYLCVTDKTTVPTHKDIVFIERLTITDGYNTDDSACKSFADSQSCTLSSSTCSNKLTDTVCGTENRTYTCQTAEESFSCNLLGSVGCSLYKKVSDTANYSIDQYACVQGSYRPVPTHKDINFVETLTITDGYTTDDSACKSFADSQSCTLMTSTCSNKLTDTVCGTENRTYTCQTAEESLTCNLLGGAGCTHYKDVSDTASTSVDQYLCVTDKTTVPTHQDIVLIETLTITDGYDTDDSACRALEENATCSLSNSTCSNKLTDTVCGTENRTYTCQTAEESLTCNLLGEAGCTHYKDVSDTTSTSVDQYLCVTSKTTVPSHEDIVFIERLTITDGYNTDDSACRALEENTTCSLSSSVCSNHLTESICGTENRTYTCQTAEESLTCHLLGGAGCTLYKEVKDAANYSIDQYACIVGSSGPIPTHHDIQFVETLTVTDGYDTDESACRALEENTSCSLSSSTCSNQLTDSICGTESRTYICQTAEESFSCNLLGGAGCSFYKEVNDTANLSIDQYLCVTDKTTVPTHQDIVLVETLTITDGYDTDDSACRALEENATCSLSNSTCSNKLTDTVCGTENRTYTCQTAEESLACNLLGGAGCTHYKDVSDTASTSVDQYLCVTDKTIVPSHQDIVLVETLTITDGYTTDDSACKPLADSQSCTLTTSTCSNSLTESICGTENRTYTCQTAEESLSCHLLGGAGCTLYKEVSENASTSVDQYACVQGSYGSLPTHKDIHFVETLTITDGYTTDDSACAPFENSQTCTLSGFTCSNKLTDTVCGTEDRTYTCQTAEESRTCNLLGGAGCSHYKDVSETASTSVDQYLCITDKTTVPTHEDIVFIERLTITDGYNTDDSACRVFEENAACTATDTQCANQLTESICGIENRTYTCAGELDSGACTVLDDRNCTAGAESCTNNLDGTCLTATKDYTCSEALPSPIASHIKETGRKEVIDSITATSDCPAFLSPYALRASSVCQEISRLCTEGAETKIVDGQPVYKDCWNYEITYECKDIGEPVNGCEQWEKNDTCELVNEECLASNGSECTYTTRTYKCKETADKVITQEKCTESVCAYGFCETRDDAPNTGLYDSILKMEVARQAAVYGEYDEVSFFKGELNTCQNKQGQNCCASKVKGNMSNESGLGAAYVFGVDASIEAVKTIGSPYVYDVLSSHESLEPLLNKLYGQAANGAYSPSLSYYGITVSYTGGSMALSFNPYVFFAMVALEVATDYFSCEPEEQALQLKRGQNLCIYLGSRCIQYNMGSCLIKEESYCCYNSRLARIVQEAAKAQFGDNWGSLQNPDCSGLTAYEFMTLDFSKIDLSEFLSDIAKQKLAEIDAERLAIQTGERIEELKNATDKYEPMDTKTGVRGM